MQGYWRAAEPRQLEPAAFARALGYPWERPAASYILRGEEVELLGDVDPEGRAEAVADFAEDRHPLLSFGGNGAPSWLATKFAHFTEDADREVLVLTGELHDFDVGSRDAFPDRLHARHALRQPRHGGAGGGGLGHSRPGHPADLDRDPLSARSPRRRAFRIDEADVAVDEIFAYIHRLGSFCVEGSPAALAAVPARDRTATPLTQEQLLDIAAHMVLGPIRRGGPGQGPLRRPVGRRRQSGGNRLAVLDAAAGCLDPAPSAPDRVEVPFLRRALQRMGSAVGELEARADHEILDRARDEDLPASPDSRPALR